MSVTKVLFVCHGNICRSTMAEFIFKNLVKEKGLENSFEITSAGVSGEEVQRQPEGEQLLDESDTDSPPGGHRPDQGLLRDGEQPHREGYPGVCRQSGEAGQQGDRYPDGCRKEVKQSF